MELADWSNNSKPHPFYHFSIYPYSSSLYLVCICLDYSLFSCLIYISFDYWKPQKNDHYTHLYISIFILVSFYLSSHYLLLRYLRLQPCQAGFEPSISMVCQSSVLNYTSSWWQVRLCFANYASSQGTQALNSWKPKTYRLIQGSLYS